MVRKKFRDLDLKDAFLFAAAMQDPEICRMVLEIILGKTIPEVKVHTEHSLLFSSDLRSVRLDVYANDTMEVTYNVEMQNDEKGELPKRSRFYQAEMDAAALKPGSRFKDLKPSYIIFICTFDPFWDGLYRYTFENRCLERDFELGDGTCKIFLNTRGTNDNEVPEILVNFLHYVEDSSDAYVERTTDFQIGKLHNKICNLKKSREWEAGYMKFEELLQDSKEEGRQEGLQEGLQKGLQKGQQRLLKLMERMSECGDAERLCELTKDKDLLEQMYKKYQI